MNDQANKLRLLTKNTYQYEDKPKIVSNFPVARVVSITSGKGGVGKTNLTVNLALALANFGQKVLIIDADLGMANVDVILGCTTKYNIMHLLDGEHELSDIVVTGPRNIILMPGGSGIAQLANLTELQLQKIINEITRFDQLVDFILIDTGAGLSRNVLNFMLASDEIIIVTTPEPTAITDAYAIMKAYATSNGAGILKLVVNRVVNREEADNVVEKLTKVVSKFLKLNISNLGYIPEDINLIKSVKNQQAVMLSYPDTGCARSIEEIAYKLIYGEDRININNQTGLKGFFNKFLNILS